MLKGRKMINYPATKEDMRSVVNVAEMVNKTIMTHVANKVDIDFLFNYWKGDQPILQKVKNVRDEINNIVVINHAQRVTRTINGYFLGTPIQYIQGTSATDVKDKIDLLNQILAYEDKSAVDTELGENQSVCGTAYKLIYTDGIFGDEVPFEQKSLNPSLTYVVYDNTVVGKPLAGVTYISRINKEGNADGRIYHVYTEVGEYVFVTESELIDDDELAMATFSAYDIGGVPVIEYVNNPSRIGDWELFMSVMNAINALQSNRLDDVEQIIQSLLVFVNADIDVEVYNQMRDKGVVMLKNMTEKQSSIESITTELDQTGMNLFAKELENLLDVLVGIPSRDSRGGGGGDTGQAVELRDGWADLEIVARNKESVYKRAEKMSLKIILKLMDNLEGLKLRLMDVDVKFSRNKSHNLLVKTQSYQTLLATQTLTPADCLSIVDLISDVNEYVQRGKAYWDVEKQAIADAELDSAVKLSNATQPKEPVVDNEKQL